MTERELLTFATGALTLCVLLIGCCPFGATATAPSTPAGSDLVNDGDTYGDQEPVEEAIPEGGDAASGATEAATDPTPTGATPEGETPEDGEAEQPAEEPVATPDAEQTPDADAVDPAAAADTSVTEASAEEEEEAAAAAAAAAEARRRRRGRVVGQVTGSGRFNSGTIVYVEGVRGRPSRRTVTMDQRNHRFVPSILPIVRGTTVRFLNSDNEAHNVFSPDNEGYDLGNWVGGETRSRRFDRSGVYTQLCRLHPSMIGYIVVLDNPHFARVRGGRFTLNLPPGRYRLAAWHPRGRGGPVSVTVRGGEETSVEIPMSRGR